MDDQNKNLILATALSFLVILVWFLLFPPEEPVTDPNAPTQITQSGETADVALTPPAAVTEAAPGAAPQTAATPTENAPRVQIDTPALEGSISLLGGRIDDLSLRNYNETLEPDSPIVRLLSPVDAPGAYYALYGWAPAGTLDRKSVV